MARNPRRLFRLCLAKKAGAAVSFRSSALDLPKAGTEIRADSSQPQPRSSAYKDSAALRNSNRLMPARQREIVDLEDAMADSALFTKDPKGFQARANRLDRRTR